MTAEEKLEQTRERNRVKQASLRQRRAARMAELEATNAKLAELAGTTPLPIPKKGVRTTQKRPAEDESPSPSPSQDKPPAHPVASGSGTSGGPPTPAPYPHWSAPRPDDRPSRSDEEVARLTGVVSRLVSRLKEYGAGEGEIGRLIAGREPSHSHGAGPSRSPLASEYPPSRPRHESSHRTVISPFTYSFADLLNLDLNASWSSGRTGHVWPIWVVVPAVDEPDVERANLVPASAARRRRTAPFDGKKRAWRLIRLPIRIRKSLACAVLSISAPEQDQG